MMPPLYRLIEVAIYALLNFLPILVLALYPFRNRLRFSYKITNLLIILMSILQLGLGVWAAFFANGHASIISAISTLLYTVFYFIAVKISFGKTLFTLLMLSNIANFIVIVSKCLEGQLFYNLAIQPYRWSFSLMMLIVDMIVLIPLFFYIQKIYTPVVEKTPSGLEWRYLWIIPATFYLVWYYCLYVVNDCTSLEVALRPSNALFLLLVNIGADLVYFVVTKLISEQNKKTELEAQNHRLAMQAQQYHVLQEKIMEAKKAKHDVRHHITLMQEHLQKHEYQKLASYLNSYQKRLPDETKIHFCENSAVNILLSYFAQQAESNHIKIIVKMDIAEDINISETDLSVLLNNLLENALDACRCDPAKDKKIIIRGIADNASLCLAIDNTFANNIMQDNNGIYLSTKHAGTGIGIESVKSIVEQYNGTIKIEQQDKMFCTSILLNF